MEVEKSLQGNFTEMGAAYPRASLAAKQVQGNPHALQGNHRVSIG